MQSPRRQAQNEQTAAGPEIDPRFPGLDLEEKPGQELAIADTPDEFATTVLALLQDPDRRERMGRDAHQYARTRYDWRMIVPLLERVYET